MEVVGLGARCDFVTEDEYRRELEAQATLPADVDEEDLRRPREPRPAVWRPTPSEIEEAVHQFRRGLSFRVTAFATLADGSRLTLDERGFGSSGPPVSHLWDELTFEELEHDARTIMLPDDEDPWTDMAERLRALGVRASPRIFSLCRTRSNSAIGYESESPPSVSFRCRTHPLQDPRTGIGPDCRGSGACRPDGHCR